MGLIATLCRFQMRDRFSQSVEALISDEPMLVRGNFSRL